VRERRLVVVFLALAALQCAEAQTWTYPAGEESTQAPFDCVFRLRVPDTPTGQDAAEIALCMQDDRNFYYAEVLGDRVWLGRCLNGRRTPIAGPAQLSIGPHEVALQRRERLLQLSVDGLRLLSAWDDRFEGGSCAVATSGKMAVEEFTVQPVAEVYMDDDFTRGPEEMGNWEPISGEWRSSGEEIERERPELSANPFSLVVKAEARALAATGYDFWDNYRVRCAIKPTDNGAVGIAAYFQDPENHYLLRWSRTAAADAPASGRLQLIKVQRGRWLILAEELDAPYQPGMWYDVQLAVADGCIEAFVNGRRRLQAIDNSFVRGRVALYAETCERAHFDDVEIRSYNRYVEQFASARAIEGRCEVIDGRWTIDAEHLYGAADGDGEALALTGSDDWADYSVDALVKLKEARRVGLVFCYRGPQDYHLARWGTDSRGQGTRELLRIADGQKTVLATETFWCVRDRFERVNLSCHRGHITLNVDDRLVLEATDVSATSGRIGFYVDGPTRACFDDVSVQFPRPERSIVQITEQFTKEETMAGWASPQACWRDLGEDRWAYDLPLFGDYRVEMQLGPLANESGSAEVYLGADEQLAGGAKLSATVADGILSLQLALGDRVLAEGRTQSGSASPVLVVERDGSAILASLEDETGATPILAQQVGSAISGHTVGFRQAGLSAGPAQVAVSSPSVLDQTFSRAPIGWRPGQGVWEVHDRWPCFPGWSWFGGADPTGDPKNPILWCVDRWAGELVLEFWSGLIMDLPKAPGYSDPSDLNATICANGKDLCSGYSFVYAGDHNSVAKIMRGNETVAQTDRGVFDNPISSNADFHRHWFKTRIHKQDGHIRYYMDDKLLLEYDDPKPISGDHIAIWSYNNGILISRVRISAEYRFRG